MPNKNKTYSSFTLEDIKGLGIAFGKREQFLNPVAVNPSEWLLQTLRIADMLPTPNEKSKSENIIVPVLMELKNKNQDKFTFLSGCELNLDTEKGLKGFCDFIFSKVHNTIVVQTPLICMVEAKFDAVQSPKAMAQCAAEMYAAQQMNVQEKSNISVIHGIVSNADQWLFMKLENNEVIIEKHIFSVEQLPLLLGALQEVIDYYHR